MQRNPIKIWKYSSNLQSRIIERISDWKLVVGYQQGRRINKIKDKKCQFLSLLPKRFRFWYHGREGISKEFGKRKRKIRKRKKGDIIGTWRNRGDIIEWTERRL